MQYGKQKHEERVISLYTGGTHVQGRFSSKFRSLLILFAEEKSLPINADLNIPLILRNSVCLVSYKIPGSRSSREKLKRQFPGRFSVSLEKIPGKILPGRPGKVKKHSESETRMVNWAIWARAG